MRLTLLYELIDVFSRCLNRCHITIFTNNWLPSLDEITHDSSSQLNMCSIFHMLHSCMISLQCVLSCTFKSFICDQVLSHCMQQSGYSSVWIFFWLFMWPDYEKDMTQVLYLNDFSPVTSFMCPQFYCFCKAFLMQHLFHHCVGHLMSP